MLGSGRISLRVRGRTRGNLLKNAVAMFLVAFSPAFVPAQASDRYQQTVVAIQQQIEANDLVAAGGSLATAMKEFPANGGLENLLGIVEVQQGQPELARQDFAKAIEHSPRLVSAYLNLARLDVEASEKDATQSTAALRLYRSVLRIEPNNPEAHYQAATLLMRSGEYQSSLDHVARLSAEGQARVSILLLECADHAGLGHKDAATRAGSKLAADAELTEQDAAFILPALRTARRADLIEEIYAAIDRRHPLSADGLRILGLAMEANEKLSEARATLERTYAADPSSAKPLADLARIAVESGDLREALGYLAHARELAPKDASYPYQFGLVCAKMNLFVEARKGIEEAVKLAPDNPEYNFSMGVIASFDEDPLAALPYLEKFRALRPSDPQGSMALGTAYFRAKDYDKAVPFLKQAVAGRQTAASANYYLGRVAQKRGQLEEAAADLQESERLKADVPEVMAELGQVYVQLKRYDVAQKQLDRALAIDPESYAANFGLLQLYVRTADPRRAEQAKKFEEVKDKSEQESREMMRAIEVDPGTGRNAP